LNEAKKIHHEDSLKSPTPSGDHEQSGELSKGKTTKEPDIILVTEMVNHSSSIIDKIQSMFFHYYIKKRTLTKLTNLTSQGLTKILKSVASLTKLS